MVRYFDVLVGSRVVEMRLFYALVITVISSAFCTANDLKNIVGRGTGGSVDVCADVDANLKVPQPLIPGSFITIGLVSK